jgi:hypothetical protein
MDHNSDQSVYTDTVTDLLTSLLFSIHYIMPPPKKNLANNMYEKDVMNRAPTLLPRKAQPYFSGGHAVLDK